MVGDLRATVFDHHLPDQLDPLASTSATTSAGGRTTILERSTADGTATSGRAYHRSRRLFLRLVTRRAALIDCGKNNRHQ